MEILIPEKEYGPLEHILITEEKSTEGLNTFMLETDISQEHHVIKVTRTKTIQFVTRQIKFNRPWIVTKFSRRRNNFNLNNDSKPK